MKKFSILNISRWLTLPGLLSFMISVSAQYCIPQHSYPLLEVIIDGVELNDIHNLDNGIAEETIGYTDFTELTTDLAAGSANTIYFENRSWQYNYSAWIDYDHDEEFEESEILGTIVLTGIQSGSLDFIVPENAINGDTRLRVRAADEPYGPWLYSNDPCLPLLQGDTEDYTVHITGGAEQNMRMVKLVSPVSATGLDDESIVVEIENNSDTDLSDVLVSYSVDGGSTILESIPDIIPANNNYIYTFSAPADFSTVGCHSIVIGVEQPDDDYAPDDLIELNICNLNFVNGSKKWLVHSNIDGGAEVLAGAPFYNTTNTTCMNNVFGEGNWTQAFFETVDPEELFSDSSCFIFMDGSFNHVVALDLFIQTNHQLIENWVAAGGKLYLNSNGSESDGEHFYVEFGFDGTFISMSYQVGEIKKKATSTHPIFSGPYTPTGNSWSAFYASNAVLYGKNYDTLAHENFDGVFFGAPHNDIPCMLEKTWGLGKVIMSAWGPSQLLDPADKGMNLRQNILVYLSDCVFEIPIDAGVADLPELHSDCTLTDEEEVKITIHNYGTSAISNIPVAYRINGGAEISETAEIMIESGEDADYIFAIPADLSVPGDYLFEIYTLLPGDVDNSNDTLSVLISSLTIPDVELGDNFDACDSVILDAGNAGSLFVWSTGETTQTITVTNSGIYSVTVTDPLSGCSATDFLTINILYLPDAAFNVTLVGYTVICEHIAGEVGTFFWDFGDGYTSTENNPSHTYAAPGTYLITCTITNECGTSEFSKEVTIQDVPVFDFSGSPIRIYPNPANHWFIVELDNLSGVDILFELYDLRGERIMQTAKAEILQAGDRALRINLPDVPAGYYTIQIISNGKIYSGRLEII